MEKLHNEDLHILYLVPNTVRQIKSGRIMWARHVEGIVEDRRVCRVLVGKPEGTRILGIPWHRWEDGIRMYLREIGWEGVIEWIHLAQDRCWWRALEIQR
jgi:hypothetical protein